MKTCRYCEEVMGENDGICPYCGYNSKTDTLTPGFVKKAKKDSVLQRQKKISPGVRRFAFLGALVIGCSLVFKYQGELGDIFWGLKNRLTGNKTAKTVKAQGKNLQSRPAAFIEVRSAKVSGEQAAVKKDKVEGIFYDPQGKSWVVIGGQLVSENQSIGDITVVKITPDAVAVIQGGKEKILRVNK
jgi:hypothetical protein